MNIAILLYDRVTALDAIGPYEVLSRLPGGELQFVAAKPGPVRTDNGMLALVAERSIEDVTSPDVVLVPGGPGEVAARAGDAVLGWLRAVHERTTWTTSVCTGSLILAAAGVLAGKRATSHWLALEELGRLGAAGVLEGLEATTHWLELETLAGFGARPVARRVVEQGKVITAAGVSAGIDMALALAAKLAGDATAQAIQLGLEYDPQPPFDAGSPGKAPIAIVELLRARSRFADSPKSTAGTAA